MGATQYNFNNLVHFPKMYMKYHIMFIFIKWKNKRLPF